MSFFGDAHSPTPYTLRMHLRRISYNNFNATFWMKWHHCVRVRPRSKFVLVNYTKDGENVVYKVRGALFLRYDVEMKIEFTSSTPITYKWLNYCLVCRYPMYMGGILQFDARSTNWRGKQEDEALGRAVIHILYSYSAQLNEFSGKLFNIFEGSFKRSRVWVGTWKRST